MDEEDVRRKAVEFWAHHPGDGRDAWWMHPVIFQHVNRLVCGDPVEGPAEGFLRRIRDFSSSRPFKRALSIGCGDARTEIALVEAGVVESFDLYELHENIIKKSREQVKEKGLEGRVKFSLEEAFQDAPAQSYDLVYWCGSLHHMLDTPKSVQWSRERLREGGLFAMFEYVGPSRFQWTETNIFVGSSLRSSLPESLLKIRDHPDRIWSSIMQQANIEYVIASDPTEAADSERILDAIRDTFPSAEIIPVGGCLYFGALTGILNNFEEETNPSHAELLKAILYEDEALIESGESLYAAAFARV